MLYPKKAYNKSQPHSNRAQQERYTESQRLPLISKLSKALKLKHVSVFMISNYNDSDLYSDINTTLTKEVLMRPTSEVFSIVEKAILAIVNQRKPCSVSSCHSRDLHKKTITAEENKAHASAMSTISNGKAIKDNEPIQVSHTFANEKHDLVDKLRLRMEMNDETSHCETAPSEVLKELKEKKQRQHEEMFVYLQKQIEEKEKRESQSKNDEKAYLAYQSQQFSQWEIEKEQAKEKKLKMRKDFRVSLEKIVKERKDLEKKTREQKKLVEANILVNNRLSLDKDKEKMSEKKQIKQQFYNEMMEQKMKCAEEKKQKKSDKLEMDRHYLIEFDEVMKKREKENEDIKERIRNQVKQKDDLEKKLSPIYSSHSMIKDDNECYIKENEEKIRKAEEEKQKEVRRKNNLIKEMKKGLDEIIKVKQKEKNDIKEYDMKYKERLVKDFNIFLNDQEKKREIQKEKKRKYKQELDTQIIEKRKHEIELLKKPYPYVSRTTISEGDQ